MSSGDNYQTPEQETILKQTVSAVMDLIEKAKDLTEVSKLVQDFRPQLKTAEVIKNPNAKKW